MSQTLKFLTLAVVIGAVALAAAGAQDAAKAKIDAPSSAPAAEAAPLQVTVREVTGTAHRLAGGDPPKWEPINPGQKLDENTVLRTGFRTRVVLAFADNSVVVVERATMMGIGQFRKDGKLTRTRLGLKYGSMRATVHKAAGPNDFTVATPVATLAVKGTSGAIGLSGDLGLALHGTSGTWNVAAGSRQRNVGPGERTDGRLTPSIQIAQNSRDTRMVDVAGLSNSEKKRLLNNGGGRGIFNFTQNPFSPILNVPSLSDNTITNGTENGSIVER